MTKSAAEEKFPGVHFYRLYLNGLHDLSGFYAYQAEESGLAAVYEAGYEAGKASLGM